jgi:diguanylate cyclase (GGDEF)-like protein
MTLAMGALLLLYGCWQVFYLTPGHRALVGNVFFYPVGVAATYAAWRASQRCSTSPRLRSAWRLLGLAFFSYLGGDVAWAIYELAGNKPYPSAGDALYLAFYPLMLAGVLRFPSAQRTRGERVRLLLDLAVVAIGGSAVVIYVVLGPVALQGGSSALQKAFSIAYPVGDMVLLVGIATLLLGRPLQCSRLALRVLAVALVFYVTSDLIFGYIALHSTYQTGDPIDLLSMVALMLLAIAAAAQQSPEVAEEVPSTEERQRPSRVPYVAVAVGFGLLLFSQRQGSLFPGLILTIAAVLLATLVSVRQFLAQRDLINTQRQLSHQSLHDALTGLPNRALALDRAQQMLARARRQQVPIAALFIDLDGFKNVNDTFGHAAGDELLRIVAKRLLTVIRDADTTARLGGDEFVILLDGSTLDAGPELVAERLLEVLRQPYDVSEELGRQLSVTGSIGIAVGINVTADELLRNADLALYAAKAAGRNHYTLFESNMQSASTDKITLEMDLADALADEQMFLLYQPTFDLRSQSVIGVEALIRWRHPTRGIVSPEEFIPIAESNGLIIPIGRWVLREACRQASIWHDRGHRIGMSVNVSARQLDEDGFIEDVRNALKDTALDPATLTLEITETALMHDTAATAVRLELLKQLGVRIAIDDFGTGYSSLAYLRQFPADALKIDRSFIDGIATSDASAALIHTLVQLGKTLNIQTLAEGIEDRAQLETLQRQHCDQGQGFLFSRPLNVDAIEQFLDASQPARASTART